jgi:AI-2 transport protein TqsA
LERLFLLKEITPITHYNLYGRSIMKQTPEKARSIENRIIVACLGILSAIAIGLVLYYTRSIILPFALAVFISYVLNPLITFFEKRKIPVAIAILLSIIITFLILNLVGVLIYGSIKSFAADFPKYEARVDQIYHSVLRFLDIPQAPIAGEEQEGDRFGIMADIQNLSVSGIILKTLGSIMNFLSNTALVLLFLLFILVGRKQLTHKIELAFKHEMSSRISSIITNINKEIQKYLVAKTLISFITGALAAIVLFLFGVEFALVWGLLTFLLNFIPTIGSFAAVLLPLGVAFFQFSDHLIMLFWLALILIAIQSTIGNVVDPRVVGKSLNLSPLVVLFSLIFWGWLWGIIGMFLAVPLAVIAKIIFENIDSLRFLSVLMSARRA